MPEQLPEEWGSYRRLILSRLDALDERMEKIANKLESLHQNDLAKIRTDIALLNLKAALAGALASMAVSVIVAVFRYIK